MNYLETLKNIAKDKKRKKENLVFILVLLVILLISMNYIFSGAKDSDNVKENNNNDVAIEINNKENNNLEERIANIISQVEGISDVSIVINYKDNGKSEYVFNTKETINSEGESLNVEKEVAFNENGSQKNAIVDTIMYPQVEGAIVVARGVENTQVKQNIQSAIASLLGIASYKVQVLNRR